MWVFSVDDVIHAPDKSIITTYTAQASVWFVSCSHGTRQNILIIILTIILPSG